MEKYYKELNRTVTEGKKILQKKSWVEEHYNNTFLKEIEVVKSWFAENLEKQSSIKLYDVNFFTN